MVSGRSTRPPTVGHGDDEQTERNRGQVYTLEAITTAIIVLSAVLFALQATAVTPLTASTANQQIEERQQTIADDILDTAAASDELTPALLYWNTDTERFDGGETVGYVNVPATLPPLDFFTTLEEEFYDNRIAFNVYVEYRDGGETKTEQLVYQGTPSDNAVSASRIVVLRDDMELTAGPDAGQPLSTVSGDFYAPDASSGTDIYNVAEVRLVVWRM